MKIARLILIGFIIYHFYLFSSTPNIWSIVGIVLTFIVLSDLAAASASNTQFF